MGKPFRRMRFGVGYGPANMMGWLVVAGFVILVAAPAFWTGWTTTMWGMVGYMAYAFVVAGGFVLLARWLSEDEDG